ncbi:hypothetical protein PCE1_001276 [Barthelona sp. PCE]
MFLNIVIGIFIANVVAFFVIRSLTDHFGILGIAKWFNDRNISMSPISWKIRFHKPKRMGGKRLKLLSMKYKFYYLGVCIALATIFGFFPYILYNTSQMFLSPKTVIPPMVPIIPGLNMPFKYLDYLVFSLLISVVVHEIGHGLCAGLFGVHTVGIEVYLLGCFPGAFISLDKKQFNKLSMIKRLMVTSAGALFNLVTWVVVIGLISLTPFVLKGAFYNVNEIGLVITDIDGYSPLKNALSSGDLLIDVGMCSTSNFTSFTTCINMLPRPPFKDLGRGHCQALQDLDEHFVDSNFCCDKPLGEFQCVSYSQNVVDTVGVSLFHKRCIDPDRIIRGDYCSTNEDCYELIGNAGICVQPELPENQMLFTMRMVPKEKMITLITNHDIKNITKSQIKGIIQPHIIEVAVIGNPQQLIKAVSVSEYYWAGVKSHRFFPIQFPQRLLKLLYCLASLSFSIGILNLMPMFFTDGQEFINELLSALRFSSIVDKLLKYTLPFLCLVVLLVNFINGAIQARVF